jgi:hypothetical protein
MDYRLPAAEKHRARQNKRGIATRHLCRFFAKVHPQSPELG